MDDVSQSIEQKNTDPPKRKCLKHHYRNIWGTAILLMIALSIKEIRITIGRQTRKASSVAFSKTFTVDALRPETTISMPRSKERRSGGRKRSGFGSVVARSSSNSNDGPTADSSYDMVVVGGGSAGLTAAKFASGTLKKSVLIVEEERLGGDCTWTGCVPSKSMLSQAKASKMARNYAIQQLSTSGSSNDGGEALREQSRSNFDKVQEYFRRVQESIYEEDDSPRALQKFGIETVEGSKAHLVSPTKLSYQTGSLTKTVEATEGILLCTGAKPNRSSSIQGLSDIDYLTYEEIWTRDFGGSLPQKWTVVGGGPIGCELAQALSRLGASVTIITGGSGRLLPSVDDAEVSELMKEVFEQDENIKVVEGKLSRVEAVGSDGADKPSNHVAYVETKSNGSVSVEGEAMLLSIGRKPNTAGLGLETIGIDLDPKTGGIAVDKTLKTTINGIYAAGDCTGDKQFTHYAGYQGAVAARNILLPFTDPGKLGNSVPTTTFTSPEVATIGYSEAAAKAKFGEKAVSVSTMHLNKVDRAVCDDATKGVIKVVYSSKGKKKILGATIMAPVAGELISEISVAMNAGMGWPSLAKAVHPYPSYAFALQSMAAEVYYEDLGKLTWLLNFLKRLGL